MTSEQLRPGADEMRTVLRVIPMPADRGIGRRITTGWLLAKLDQAGAVLPSGLFGRAAVLASCGALDIQQPVHMGDCVTFRAAVVEADASAAVVSLQVLTEKRGETLQREVMWVRLRYVPVPEREEGSGAADAFRFNA